MTTAIALSGAPARIGRLWGSTNAQAIAHDLHEHYLKPAREEGVSTEMLVERSQRFVEIAARIAPWWLEEAHPRHRGLMNTFMLRFIAETCASCEAALDVIQDYVSWGYYAGGGRTGTHWLFVDREGTALEVSHNAGDVSFAYHPEKAYSSARTDSRAATALRQAPSPIGFHAFHRTSRDPSICFDTSIAGMTVEIDREYPSALTCAWISLPARSLSFPIFMGQASTPTCLLSGQAHALGGTAPCTCPIWEQVEEELHADKQTLRKEAASLLEGHHPEQAASLVDEWGQAQAARCLGLFAPGEDHRR